MDLRLAFHNALIKEASPTFKTLKKNRDTMAPEELREVFRRKAVWHHGLGTKDPKDKTGKTVSAIHKSKVDGKTYYYTYTHRAGAVRPTLAGAISIYHRFIEGTA